MKKDGFYAGSIDTVYDEETKEALQKCQ
ncbi:MAG: hypothetical protein ACTSRR_05420 [Candidatus Heimdallarchaeaceae archaeon]